MIAKIEGLTKNYPGVRALNHVSFSLKKREIVGLIGANGAGKSTCMKCLLGLVAPTKGRITIKGRPLYPDPHKARRSVGYLPEGNPLPEELRVSEYLRFMASLKECKKRAVEEQLNAMELQEVASRIIGHLSSGYRQRVGLAAAFLGWPPLIILDEPNRGLDPFQRETLSRLIRRAAKESAVLISSHGLDELERMASRFVLLVEGGVTFDGPLSREGEALRKLFLERGRA